MITTIVVLIVCGILAVILELVIPGGVVGVLGAILLIVASVLTFIHHGFTAGALVSFGIAVLGAFALRFWMKNFHRLPVTRQMIVNDEVGHYDTLEEFKKLVGQKGIAHTDLRPSGTAIFGDQRIDVVAESSVLEKGTEITVVAVNGPSITVAAVA